MSALVEKQVCPFCKGVIFVQYGATPDGLAKLSHEAPTCEGLKAKMTEVMGRLPEIHSREHVVVVSLAPDNVGPWGES